MAGVRVVARCMSGVASGYPVALAAGVGVPRGMPVGAVGRVGTAVARAVRVGGGAPRCAGAGDTSAAAGGVVPLGRLGGLGPWGPWAALGVGCVWGPHGEENWSRSKTDGTDPIELLPPLAVSISGTGGSSCAQDET